MPRIIASIEARMNSSRFPGKVLADVHGRPALSRLLNRLRLAETINDIVLATSKAPSDDALEKWAASEQIQCYRGSEDNVLNRVTKAHKMMHSDIIVEVTGDCTLLDPEVIDLGVKTFLENDCDVVTNVRQLSFPMGVDVQVFRFRDIEAIEKTVTDDLPAREHVSLYFYEHPEKYRIIHLKATKLYYGPELRFQLDYQEDYKFINEIYRKLEPQYGNKFGTPEILALLHKEPTLLEINRHCKERAAR